MFRWPLVYFAEWVVKKLEKFRKSSSLARSLASQSDKLTIGSLVGMMFTVAAVTSSAVTTIILPAIGLQTRCKLTQGELLLSSISQWGVSDQNCWHISWYVLSNLCLWRRSVDLLVQHSSCRPRFWYLSDTDLGQWDKLDLGLFSLVVKSSFIHEKCVCWILVMVTQNCNWVQNEK